MAGEKRWLPITHCMISEHRLHPAPPPHDSPTLLRGPQISDLHPSPSIFQCQGLDAYSRAIAIQKVYAIIRYRPRIRRRSTAKKLKPPSAYLQAAYIGVVSDDAIGGGAQTYKDRRRTFNLNPVAMHIASFFSMSLGPGIGVEPAVSSRSSSGLRRGSQLSLTTSQQGTFLELSSTWVSILGMAIVIRHALPASGVKPESEGIPYISKPTTTNSFVPCSIALLACPASAMFAPTRRAAGAIRPPASASRVRVAFEIEVGREMQHKWGCEETMLCAVWVPRTGTRSHYASGPSGIGLELKTDDVALNYTEVLRDLCGRVTGLDLHIRNRNTDTVIRLHHPGFLGVQGVFFPVGGRSMDGANLCSSKMVSDLDDLGLTVFLRRVQTPTRRQDSIADIRHDTVCFKPVLGSACEHSSLPSVEDVRSKPNSDFSESMCPDVEYKLPVVQLEGIQDRSTRRYIVRGASVGKLESSLQHYTSFERPKLGSLRTEIMDHSVRVSVLDDFGSPPHCDDGRNRQGTTS
ncbi:hypothetical protein JB92DRAFT_2834514 [Gautieria morchelliformis]|nr:hypothetical protein JB92DRAFT_2834514 [Gautieria morchelliformis]